MNSNAKTHESWSGSAALMPLAKDLRLGAVFFGLITGMFAFGQNEKISGSKPAGAASLTPPPARLSFHGVDDPVGYVPGATSQSPNPPDNSYNPDGTRVDCPAETTAAASYAYPGLTGQEATVSFVRKKLNGDGCAEGIAFPSPKSTVYPVYSTVPERMTIAYGYAHPYEYFDRSQLPNWKNGTVAPPGSTSSINCGSSTSTAAGTGETGDTTPVLVARNSSANCQQWSSYYVPNLPDAKSEDGSADLDHEGLTENMVWNTDEYLKIGDDPNFYPASEHMFQYGWAFDPRNVGQTIFWNALDNIAAGGLPQNLLAIEPGQPDSAGNSLMWTIQGKYWCNSPVDCTNRSFTKITQSIGKDPDYPFPDPTTWLKNGAFVPYFAMPGFQLNLLREFTPSGAFTVLNNTSGLFVRNDGSVEFPLDGNGKPYPTVIQTWDGEQQFVALNRTNGAITGTNDLYPGDEVYYLGNTFLPGEAGVITHWSFYPWTALSTGQAGKFAPSYANGSVKHTFDQRSSDGWLGMKDDLPEDVLAWNNSVPVGKIDTVLIGGQARKPYMLGAGEQFGDPDHVPDNKETPFPPSNVNLRHILRMEHSNSFHLWRVKNADGATMQRSKMYKTSLYLTDASGNYTLLASLSWTFHSDWGFADDTQPVAWAAGKSDGYGAWVQSLEMNPAITAGKDLPPGWVWVPNADGKGLGMLQIPNGNVSIKAIQSTWAGAIDWSNEVSWNEGGPGNGTTARANQAGANVVRFQVTADVGDTKTKFVLAMESLP